MGTFIKHIPCVECGSSDAGALYVDGTASCHICKAWWIPDGTEKRRVSNSEKPQGLITGSYTDLPDRKIREDICRKFGYGVGDYKGEKCHIANYRDDKGQTVAQKIRLKGKKFAVLGNGKNMPLFGQHLFSGGKSVVITEGEIDALSVAQAFDGKWPVVSLPNGAQAAGKALQAAYEWLDGFERIVLCFDQDDPGRKATQEAAEILPAGKAFIMNLGRKDASDVLVKDGAAPITNAFWNAKPWRPDGIISGAELTREELQKVTVRGYSLPYPKLDEMIQGLRGAELTWLTAGSGVGKSTFARELAYHLHQEHGLTIGNIFLEEGVEKTAKGYIAIDNNVKLGDLRSGKAQLSNEQWDASIDKLLHQRMYFYRHFGSMDSARLLAKMRYMRSVLKVDFIILDHISIVVSGQESSSEGERKDIDRLVTNLRGLIEETGVGVIGISHLRQAEGKSHEEGGRVTLSQLRGSGSLKQLADNVIALERDQQDNDSKDQSLVRILKCREFGELGEADTLTYDRVTGRLVAYNTEFDEQEGDKVA